MKSLAPLVVALVALVLLPFVSSEYVIGVAITAFTFTVAASCLNLVYGYAGLLSFAQLAFWGIGGYCTALVVVDAGGSFWTGLALAAVLNAVLSVIVGWAAMRLQRDSFVIVTLSFSLLTFMVARDWVSLTRGPLGLPGLPSPQFFGQALSSIRSIYWLAFVFMLLALGLLYAIVSSRIGRMLLAIKQNQPLALAHGVNPTPYKLFAFAIAAAITAMAGGIQVFYLKIVDPSMLDFYYLQAWLIMVIIGGAGTFWGVVVSGMAMSILPETLRFSNELRMVLYGVILVVAVLVLPQGVAGWLREKRIARLRKDLSGDATDEPAAPLSPDASPTAAPHGIVRDAKVAS